MTARQTKSRLSKAGYGNPPRHTRFYKGRSGNPRGRPPRDPVQRLKARTLQEAYRWTAVKQDGYMVPVTFMQAILRSRSKLAAKGNIQAQRAILAAVRRFEKEDEHEAMLAEIRLGIYGLNPGPARVRSNRTRSGARKKGARSRTRRSPAANRTPQTRICGRNSLFRMEQGIHRKVLNNNDKNPLFGDGTGPEQGIFQKSLSIREARRP